MWSRGTWVTMAIIAGLSAITIVQPLDITSLLAEVGPIPGLVSADKISSSCCVVFALDESDSLWDEDFAKLTQFATSIISTFNGSYQQVGMLKFASNVRVVFKLNEYTNLREAINITLDLRKRGGTTNIAGAIRHMNLLMDACPAGYKKAGIVITDGNSDNPPLADAAAHTFKQDGHMFVVGVGNDTAEHELDSIATNEGSVFHVSFGDLPGIISKLGDETCSTRIEQAPTATVPTQPPECRLCDLINGKYIYGDKDHCNMFRWCLSLGQSHSTRKPCPFNQFFDPTTYTCRPIGAVHCASDPCRDRSVVTYANHFRCSSYFVCENGRTVREECCGSKEVFLHGSCQPDASCRQTCPPKLPDILICDLEEYPNFPTMYVQIMSATRRMLRMCAPGTPIQCTRLYVFDSLRPSHHSRTQSRDESLQLPLTKNTRDANKKYYIMNRGRVRVSRIPGTTDRAGYFSGRSRLIIPATSMASWGNKLLIRTQFLEDSRSPIPNDAYETIFSNGDCSELPSICVNYRRSDNSVQARLVTQLGNDPVVATVNNVNVGAFKAIELTYDGSNLSLTVDGVTKVVRTNGGNIAIRSNALQVSGGCTKALTGNVRFTGYQREFQMYKCIL